MSSIDEEIANRLKALKAEQRVESDKPKTNVITITSTKTNEEEVRALIRQLTEESDIDTRQESYDVDMEIRQRLDKLKCFEASLSKHETSPETAPKVEEDDELPWCILCNEDGSVRCSGCENDIYCTRCYFEFHDKDDLDLHTPTPMKK